MITYSSSSTLIERENLTIHEGGQTANNTELSIYIDISTDVEAGYEGSAVHGQQHLARGILRVSLSYEHDVTSSEIE